MAILSLSRPAVVRAAPAAARRPLRVTHVVFDFNGGGMESLVAEMATRFRYTPVTVSLITLSGRVGRLGASTRHLFDSFQVVKPVPVASLLLPRGVAAAIRRTRADVVHLHTGAWYKGARAARLAGIRRVVYTEHGREHDDPQLKQWIDRRAAHLTDAVVGVSGRLSRYLSGKIGIPARKVCTIHNGVDTTLFTPGLCDPELARSLGIPADALIIGSVGRLEAVKGYDVLLEAAALMRARWERPFAIVLFGDGSQRAELEQHAARLGIGDMVRFPGWTDQAVEAYRLIDVFVLASRSEGQSVSLMEAMACGIAPVVTDVGANAEMLGPALEAQVVAPQSPGALADAIMRTARSRDTVRSLAAAVRLRANQHFSLDRMIEQYERLYHGAPLLDPTA